MMSDTKATAGMCACCTRLLAGRYPFVTARGIYCSRDCAEEDAEFPLYNSRSTERWPRYVNRLEE